MYIYYSNLFERYYVTVQETDLTRNRRTILSNAAYNRAFNSPEAKQIWVSSKNWYMNNHRNEDVRSAEHYAFMKRREYSINFSCNTIRRILETRSKKVEKAYNLSKGIDIAA